MDPLYEELRSRECLIVAPPETAPWGERLLAVRDPAGNTLVFCGPVPGD